MNLHFIRPEWLLALVPLALALLSLWRQHESHSAWNRYIAPHLAKILVTQGNKKSRRPLHLLALTWLIATLALAGGDEDAAERLALQAWSLAHGIAMLMLDGRLSAQNALIERLIDLHSLVPLSHGSSSDEHLPRHSQHRDIQLQHTGACCA